MTTKHIRVDEDLYERIKSESEPDERLSETLERLIGGPSLTDLAGTLSEEEADEFRDVVDDVREDTTAEVDDVVEQFESAEEATR
ncbi:MAG: antitoxin VapB family protein [Halobaculum sp.]